MGNLLPTTTAVAKSKHGERLTVGDSFLLTYKPDQGIVPERRSEADEILEAHEYERQRIGQELHDSTGQLVISLLLDLARLKSVYEGRDADGLIDQLEETVRQIDAEIRSFAFLHHHFELKGQNLGASLETFVIGFAERAGLKINFECSDRLPELDQPVAIALLRIAQEALVNVYRHARATRATVKLSAWLGQIQLTVADDGCGLRANSGTAIATGIGLQGMRHRAQACGGDLQVRNVSPGFEIVATIPCAT